MSVVEPVRSKTIFFLPICECLFIAELSRAERSTMGKKIWLTIGAVAHTMVKGVSHVNNESRAKF